MPGNASRPPAGDAENGAERWTGGCTEGGTEPVVAVGGTEGCAGGRTGNCTEGRSITGSTEGCPEGEGGAKSVPKGCPEGTAARVARSVCTQAKSARC